MYILAVVALHLAEATPQPQPPRPAYWWAGPVTRTIIHHGRETPKDSK
jgi:hypothetical protein